MNYLFQSLKTYLKTRTKGNIFQIRNQDPSTILDNMDKDINISKLVFQGGDERLDLLSNGLNKYYINPIEYKGILLRGSCTCNPLNSFSHQAIVKKFGEGDVDFEALRDQHTARLKKLFNYDGQDAFDIIFAPSGSDLPYIPLLFSKLLSPEKDIKLLLTCPEELGSGSQMAFLGKNFSAKVQFGTSTGVGEDINPLYNIGMERFSARNKKGEIIDNKLALEKIVASDDKNSIIGALVIGSKSGIEDDISIVPDVSSKVMWVVDLCQLRNSKKLVNQLLDKNCLVMITGSKFYMSPPFSGAILVPKKLSEKIKSVDVNSVAEYLDGYKELFSIHDFPKEWSDLRKKFRNQLNKGLVVRWEAALHLMERFDDVPRAVSQRIIADWNSYVTQCIDKSKFLELMPQQDQTNQTIISFRVKDQDGKWLDYEALKTLHKAIVTTPFEFEKFDKVLIGQPVRYSNGAFLRFALGAYNIIKISNKKEEDRYTVDQRLVSHIDQLIK